MSRRLNGRRLAGCLLLLSCFGGTADGQGVQFGNLGYSKGVIRIQAPDAPHPVYDYFDAGKDRSIRERLQTVEQYHMHKGVVGLIGSGQYKYALDEINFTLSWFPNHPTALHLLTTIAALSKNKSLPIRYFENAIAMYPGHAITHAQYGRYFVTIDNLVDGIKKLNDAIQMDPKLVAGHVWLAQAYEKKGDLRLAREASERAKELGFTGKLPLDPGK